MVTADTSFLFSLYGQDANTPRARRLAISSQEPITISVFNDFELGNAVRLSVFRKLIPPEMGFAMLADFEADKDGGRIVMASCNLADVLTEARRLSFSYTLNEGHRAFDILHVAAATVLKARRFFTFDVRQLRLARASGLKVNG